MLNVPLVETIQMIQGIESRLLTLKGLHSLALLQKFQKCLKITMVLLDILRISIKNTKIYISRR